MPQIGRPTIVVGHTTASADYALAVLTSAKWREISEIPSFIFRESVASCVAVCAFADGLIFGSSDDSTKSALRACFPPDINNISGEFFAHPSNANFLSHWNDDSIVPDANFFHAINKLSLSRVLKYLWKSRNFHFALVDQDAGNVAAWQAGDRQTIVDSLNAVNVSGESVCYKLDDTIRQKLVFE